MSWLPLATNVIATSFLTVACDSTAQFVEGRFKSQKATNGDKQADNAASSSCPRPRCPAKASPKAGESMLVYDWQRLQRFVLSFGVLSGLPCCSFDASSSSTMKAGLVGVVLPTAMVSLYALQENGDTGMPPLRRLQKSAAPVIGLYLLGQAPFLVLPRSPALYRTFARQLITGVVLVGSSHLVSRSPAHEQETADDAFMGAQPKVAAPLMLYLSCRFLVNFGVGALAPNVALFGHALGLGSSVNFLLMSVPSFVMLALTVPAGIATDTYGRRWPMIMGMACTGVGDAICGLSSGALGLTAGALVLGLGRAFGEAGDRAFLADLCTQVPAIRGRVLAAQQTMTALAYVLGPIIGGQLVQHAGPRSPFVLVALAAAFSTSAFILLLPETRPIIAADADNSAGTASGKSRTGLIATLLKQPPQQGLLIASLANTLGNVGKITVLPLFGTTIGMDASSISRLFSAVAITELISAPAAGWIADRVGNRHVVTVGSVLGAVGLASAAVSRSPAQLLLAMWVWGVSHGAMTPMIQAAAQELAPRGQEGQALTVPKVAGDMAFLAGPAALSGVGAAYGQGAALVLCALPLALGSVFFWASTGPGPTTSAPPASPTAQAPPTSSTAAPESEPSGDPAPAMSLAPLAANTVSSRATPATPVTSAMSSEVPLAVPSASSIDASPRSQSEDPEGVTGEQVASL